jgi:proteasome lid subunit RPN8/RPN11
MSYLEDLKSHAEANSSEICGLVINLKGKAKYFPCNNISKNSANEFILDPIDYARYETLGEVLYICHSHVTVDEKPSKIDIEACNRGSTPWIIYSTVTKKHSLIEPSGLVKPLLGREYIYNVYDCWSLVIDLYKEERGIILPRVIKDSDFNWYLDPTKNYFHQYATEAGFTLVKDKSLKPYDVMLFQTGKAAVPNHVGAYYGNNLFIHHAYNRLSTKETLGAFWRKYMQAVYRY